VAAAEPHARTGIVKGAHLDPSEVEQRRGDLEEAQRFLSERGIDAEPVEAQGDPGAVIVEAAKDADLIVVGSRGLNPVQRILLGSVSSKVVHRAACDVLVVR
jgi:nucleotide-binding universal stress UspA family protein